MRRGTKNREGLSNSSSSFDDPDVIAGQGTIGMEIIRQANGKAEN